MPRGCSGSFPTSSLPPRGWRHRWCRPFARVSVLLVRRSHCHRRAPRQCPLLPGAGRSRCRNQLRRHRLESRGYDCLAGGTGDDHDHLHARADRRFDAALDHGGFFGFVRGGAAGVAGTCAARLDHGGDRGKRTHSSRQSRDSPRIDHGARGHGARIFRAAPGADRAFRVVEALALHFADRLSVCALGLGTGGRRTWAAGDWARCLHRQAYRRWYAARAVRDIDCQDARVPRAGIPGRRADARPACDASSLCLAEPVMHGLTFDVAHLLAGTLVLVSFLELYQDRLYALLNMYALHALVLALSVAWQAYIQDAPHLYVTAAIALIFKAIIIPVALHRIIVRLGIHREIEKVVGVGSAMLLGMGLVALSVVLLGLLMMVTRRNAVSQIVGFMSLENGLVLAATGAKGMPLVVEISIAFSILIAFIVIGIFLFRIRERFDTVDLQALDRFRGERG